MATVMALQTRRWIAPAIAGLLVVFSFSCGNNASLFNPAFVNTLSGTYFPRTPGPGADFILVRAVNETAQNVNFIVTVERREFVLDNNGNPQYDENGNPITRNFLESRELNTFPTGRASELGVLFPCDVSPVLRIGLGETLLPTDAAVFVGGGGPAGAPGFGVPAAGLNPLSLFEGNFNCGDTVIFRAFTNTGVPGNVSIQVFLLPGSEQPFEFRGPNTFVNLQNFLETQVREQGP